MAISPSVRGNGAELQGGGKTFFSQKRALPRYCGEITMHVPCLRRTDCNESAAPIRALRFLAMTRWTDCLAAFCVSQ